MKVGDLVYHKRKDMYGRVHKVIDLGDDIHYEFAWPDNKIGGARESGRYIWGFDIEAIDDQDEVPL